MPTTVGLIHLSLVIRILTKGIFWLPNIYFCLQKSFIQIIEFIFEFCNKIVCKIIASINIF